MSEQTFFNPTNHPVWTPHGLVRALTVRSLPVSCSEVQKLVTQGRLIPTVNDRVNPVVLDWVDPLNPDGDVLGDIESTVSVEELAAFVGLEIPDNNDPSGDEILGEIEETEKTKLIPRRTTKRGK